MSFRENKALQPHAYVLYTDKGKETIPLTFIQKFPTSWRAKGWDKNYLFKTFWSPDDDDSPELMQKRVDEIPVYEGSTFMQTPGYYRAAVIAVEESLPKLEALLANKRPSVGKLQFKYCSFDESNDKCKENKTSSSSTSNAKVSFSQESTVPPKKRRKGIHLEAQSLNTGGIRDDISKLFFPDVEKKIDEKITPVSCALEESSPVNMVKLLQTSAKEENLVHEIEAVSLILPGNKGPKAAQSPDLPKKSPKRRAGTARKKSDENVDTSDTYSSDSAESTFGSKKVDPDFAPEKYQKLKEDYKIIQVQYERVRTLNLKHQDTFLEWHAENKALRKENEELKKEIILFKSAANNNLSNESPKNVKFPIQTKISKIPAVSKTPVVDPTVTLDSSMEDLRSNLSNELPKNLKFPIQTKIHKTTAVSETPAMDNLSLTSDTSLDNLNSDIYSIALCSVSMSSEEHTKELVDPNTDEAGAVAKEDILDENSDDDSLSKCISMASAAVKKLIRTIPKGKKKDIRFIKDIAIVAFGPEVLASSSIFGTAKGGSRGNKKCAEKKPKLDTDLLGLIRNALVKRVAEEEGKPIIDPDLHDRTSKSRFYEAVRGAQKRCRAQGYGEGKKANELDEGLLRD